MTEVMVAEAKDAIERNDILKNRAARSVRLINWIWKDYGIRPECEPGSSEPLDELLFAFYNKYGNEGIQELIHGFRQAIVESKEKILTETDTLYPSHFECTHLDSPVVREVFNHVVDEARMLSDDDQRADALNLILSRLERMIGVKSEIAEISAQDIAPFKAA